MSYLIYPKVFAGYGEAARRYGPVSVLPTPVYFYGMAPGDEINATIEQGKTLVIRLPAIGGIKGTNEAPFRIASPQSRKQGIA